MTTTFADARALVVRSTSRAAWLRDPHLWTRVALPLLLLASAILKSHQMITSPFEDGSYASASVAYWWWQIAVVCAQIVLSFWLLSGHWLRLGWLAAAAIFVIFAAVSLWGVARGDTVCASCFGAVRISRACWAP